jgi:hypothetical protein
MKIEIALRRYAAAALIAGKGQKAQLRLKNRDGERNRGSHDRARATSSSGFFSPHGRRGISQRMAHDDDEMDDFDLQGELREGAVIQDARGGGYAVSFSGKYVDRTEDFKKALLIILKKMDKDKYFPNVFYVNDHGNVDLLAVTPKMVKGKIIGASYKILQSWV